MDSWKDNFMLDMPNDIVRYPDGSPIIVKNFKPIIVTNKKSMSQKNQSFLFICRDDEGDIVILTREEVDFEIKQAEERIEIELRLETIGKIRSDVFLDFNESEIKWYTDEDRDKKFTDNVVLKICQKLKNGH